METKLKRITSRRFTMYHTIYNCTVLQLMKVYNMWVNISSLKLDYIDV